MRRLAVALAVAVLCLDAACSCGAAVADTPVDVTIDQTLTNAAPLTGVDARANVDGSLGEGVTGAVAANVASGAVNAQANTIVLSPGALAGISARTVQSISGLSSVASGTSSAAIGGRVFAGASGQAALNVAAGAGNQQANTILIGR